MSEGVAELFFFFFYLTRGTQVQMRLMMYTIDIIGSM